MKVTVLCGGNSSERQVSIVSGYYVGTALASLGHDVTCMDVFTGDVVSDLQKITSQPPSEMKRADGMLFSPSILPICLESDVVFLALHGGMGENGQLQALLECYGIKYTGASYAPSLLCMDKGISREVLGTNGVSIPKGITVSSTKDINITDFPVCVKPASSGSSVGVSFPNSMEELIPAVESALAVCPRVVIEEKIVGREFTVGILDGKALPIVEILPKTGVYNYESKYDPDLVSEICPAPLTAEEEEAIKNTALAAKDALLVDSYCRVDVMLSNGVPYCLEINTLPGMTKTSLLPLSAKTAGISFPELCQRIINEALK